jgi:hypothetical protein
MTRKLAAVPIVMMIVLAAAPAQASDADPISVFKFATGSATTTMSSEEHTFFRLGHIGTADELSHEFDFDWDHFFVEDGVGVHQEISFEGPYNDFQSESRYHQRKLRAAHFAYRTANEGWCIETPEPMICEIGPFTIDVTWEGYGRRRTEVVGTVEVVRRRAVMTATVTLNGEPLPGSDQMIGKGALYKWIEWP